ncbi:MAG TPA: gluconate 2-dehydrogenase subunit 3 family protein [Verrucomicrobiae bacterium]|jgi:hypothetical protein|nr:gluconate 2-dehydrogenase subunit 3 family protein [Verrucomicrobiae bacterium]
MSEESFPPRLSRREALRWVAVATASTAFFSGAAFSAGAAPKTAQPYGTDPLLNDTYDPGAFWPLTLDAAQRRTLVAVCDLIIPADEKSPAASHVGVPDFIDEWISAPYPSQQAHRPVVLEGLKWLDEESRRRFGKLFHELTVTQQSEIADLVCAVEPKDPSLRHMSRAFALLRSLTVGGYYTTPAGLKDLGFVGNVALPAFPEAPREVLQKLGLT